MGKPAVIVGIQKQPTADTVDADAQDRGRARRTFRRRCLPGITATNVQFRQATFIETSIDNVERVLVEAAVVVAVVLFAVPDERARDPRSR